MAHRRGFFAELQHQQAVAARNRQRIEAHAVREHARLVGEMKRAQLAEERARTSYARASAASAREAERLQKSRHLESRIAETALLNADLELQILDIDNILTSTLEVDDFVDLEQLRTQATHPPFSSPSETPIIAPVLPQAPPEPGFAAAPPPTGRAAMFGGKKKYTEYLARANAEFAAVHEAWRQEAARIPGIQLQLMNRHRSAEEARVKHLASDRAAYQAKCTSQQEKVDQDNAKLDGLIAGLAAGEREAVEEYAGIVIGKSVYPECVPGVTEWTYDPVTGELQTTFTLPTPDQVPTIRAYRYVKASDEITATYQTQKEQRDRYNNLVYGAALRTLHEMWESDRAGNIRTISFRAEVQAVDPGTGLSKRVTLVEVAAEREQFLALNLAQVTPSETLRYLNANVSKNPYAFAGLDSGHDVRAHGS